MGSVLKWSALVVCPALFIALDSASGAGGPWTRITVCTAPGGRAGVKIAPDGHGGAFIAWYDQRNETTSKFDLYVQRINAGGIAKLSLAGQPLCTALEDQYNVAIGTDGEGGVIAAWSDRRNPLGYVFAQRVDDRGASVWAADGISIAPAQDGLNPRVEPDGSGGAFIAWEALAAGLRGIHAQRLDSGGRLIWGSSGVAVCTAPGFHFAPCVVSDGDGGVFIAWTDMRGPTAKVFAQHVRSSGAPAWNVNGIPVCGVSSEQSIATAVGDGAGGVILVWRDSRKAGSGSLGLFAQRLNGAGQLLWDGAGVDLCRPPLKNDLFVVACASSGGAIIGWHDDRAGQYNIHAQAVSADGRVLWDAEAPGVCVAPRDQVYPAITSDGEGGAFFSWQDNRDRSGGVFVQHMLEDGSTAWGPAGAPVSTSGPVGFPAISGDGRGGAFVTWIQGSEVLAERVTDSGGPGHGNEDVSHWPTSGRSSLGGTMNGGLLVRMSMGPTESAAADVYDLNGRRIRELGAGHPEFAERVWTWDGRDEHGRKASSGVYFVRVQSERATKTIRALLMR